MNPIANKSYGSKQTVSQVTNRTGMTSNYARYALAHSLFVSEEDLLAIKVGKRKFTELEAEKILELHNIIVTDALSEGE